MRRMSLRVATSYSAITESSAQATKKLLAVGG